MPQNMTIRTPPSCYNPGHAAAKDTWPFNIPSRTEEVPWGPTVPEALLPTNGCSWKGYLFENGVASGEQAGKKGFRGKGRGITEGNVGKCIRKSLYLCTKLWKKSLNIQKVQTYIQKISVGFLNLVLQFYVQKLFNFPTPSLVKWSLKMSWYNLSMYMLRSPKKLSWRVCVCVLFTKIDLKLNIIIS